MKLSEPDIILLVFAVTIVVLVLSCFAIFFTLMHKRKQQINKEEKIVMSHQFQQQLLQSQLEMQEQTFNTISGEIHDNVGQILSLVKVQLNIIHQTGTLDNHLLQDARDSVSKAMTDLRDIAKSLNSERIRQSSLSQITEHELQRINRLGVMLASLRTEGLEQAMEQQKKLITFRIIQEALQNIIKHSKAKNIHVLFCYDAHFLQVQISDDGIGFNPQLVTQQDGLGLHTIVNRASLIGGKATIESTPNKGTTLTITSPYV